MQRKFQFLLLSVLASLAACGGTERDAAEEREAEAIEAEVERAGDRIEAAGDTAAETIDDAADAASDQLDGLADEVEEELDDTTTADPTVVDPAPPQ